MEDCRSVRVVRDEFDRVARRARLRGPRRRPGWRVGLSGRTPRRGRARRARPRRVPQARARSPARDAHALPPGRKPPPLRRAASTDATSASALRPAAAQCGASSAGAATPLRASSPASLACSSSRSPGRMRRVDRLGEQGVPESEGARRLIGDEHGVLHRSAQRRTHIAAPEAPRQHKATDIQRRVRRPQPLAGGPVSDGRVAPRAAAADRAGCVEAPRSDRWQRRAAPRRRRGCPRYGRRSRRSAPQVAGCSLERQAARLSHRARAGRARR